MVRWPLLGATELPGGWAAPADSVTTCWCSWGRALPNYLDSLIDRIEDAAVRADLIREIRTLRNRKDFGLVFERHLPETVRLYSLPLKVGATVQERADNNGPIWTVRRLARGKATLERRAGAETISQVLPVDKLVVLRKFNEAIYPGLTSLGRIERGDSARPFHAVIQAENYHALETLLYAYEGMVDCIYIDPPYNSGAKDWKYNNDYVDAEDAYRHSKWLAFMERRLLLAKRLLRQDCSVLIVTIDEKEYLRLGLLLEQLFPGCRVQMVSITVSPRSTSRANEFSRVDEYAFFVFMGSVQLGEGERSGHDAEVRWLYLRRTQRTLVRGSRPRQFYPVYVDQKSERIVHIGEPLSLEDRIEDVPKIRGAVPVFPVNPDGVQLIWGLTGPSLQQVLDKGFVRVTPGNEHQPYTIAYLSLPDVRRVEAGTYKVTGTRPDGSKIVVVPGGKAARPSTVWRESRHDAGAYGTTLLGSLIPGRKFPFPKSLYAVEDTLRYFVGSNPRALILDFFAGSGSTGHAVMRLNRQDGGSRRALLVTNNEVSDAEASQLAAAGLAPGDAEWEALGIFEHVTRPRLTAAVTGCTPEGREVDGDYKFTDEFPIAEGFAENVEFFRLDYLDRDEVSLGRAFQAVAPLLWLKAGGVGTRIDRIARPWSLPEGAVYGILFDPQHWAAFARAVQERLPQVRHVFVVTDSTAVFQQVSGELPPGVATTMLYEDYLSTFAINAGNRP